MRVIISKTLNEIKGYRMYDHVSNLSWVGVDTLVFHSCVEDDVAFTFALTKLPASVKTIVYINNNLEPLFCSLFTGMQAFIYNDEAFLSDGETLDFLIENVGALGCEFKSGAGDIETLQKFIDKLAEQDPVEVSNALSNGHWLSTLNAAVSNMSTSLTITEQSSAQLVEFVGKVNGHINSLEEQNKHISDEISRMRSTINSLGAKQLGQTMSLGAMKYGTYNVPAAVRKVLYVRCFGDVPYLTTFMCMFFDWVTARHGKNTTAKLLIAKPNLSNNLIRYQNIAKLTATSGKMVDMKTPMFVTYEPTKPVLDTFFGVSNINLFIVLDFMQADSELLHGHMVRGLSAYATRGIYDNIPYDRVKAPARRSLFSIDTSLEGSLLIPYINGYHNLNEGERRSVYFKSCSKLYERIWDIVEGV